MSEALEKILSGGIVSICRKVYGNDLALLSDALSAGGVMLMEVTFDQADPDCLKKTGDAISMLRERHPEMCIGAGTVVTPVQVDTVNSVGGEFVISPNVDLGVISRTKELGLVSIPGAMTPSEILTAHNAGADVVKLFPAGWLGLKYIKDITAPISHVRLMATGGVTEDNLADFLAVGCMGAGIGSFLSDKKLIAAGDWAEFTRRASVLSGIFNDYMEGKK